MIKHTKQNYTKFIQGNYNDFIKYCKELGVKTDKLKINRNLFGFVETIEFIKGA